MASATESAAAGDVLPFKATEATLANSLHVIVVPTGYPNLVSLQIPVQTGSRNEIEPGRSGFAHFFEHMMFRGTERYPADAYQDIVTRTGARQNAYTTDDYTNYHITFAREDLEKVLEIEADRFMHLSYPEAAFKTEARAVLGEYNKSSSNPLMKLIEVQQDHAFTVHPYKHTTMGFLADIEAMPEQYDYSRTFFARWYRPEYTTLVIAGDVDPAEVIPLVEKYWGGWQPGGQSVAIPAEPPPRGPVTAHVPWPVPTLPYIAVAFHDPPFSTTQRDFAALDIMLDLFFGQTSDLYRRLVEEEQVVDQLFAGASGNIDPGLTTILARVRRPEDAVLVRDAILRTVAEARAAPIPAGRLEEAKSHARYAFVRTLDNSESVASTLARFVRFQRSYDTLNALYRVYAALSPDDLLRVARTYLTDAGLVQTTLSHAPLPDEIERVPAIDSLLQAEPAAGPAPEFVVLRSPSTLLRFKLAFRAGSAHDPAGREGLAALTAEMIAGAGSATMRIDEVNRALFPMAGSFSARVDRELAVFTGVIHRDNLDRFADIVLKQLISPGMREADFSRIKARQLSALLQDLRNDNEEELGRERLQTNVFAGTSYGHTTLGTAAGIEAIELDDVRGFAQRAYTRAGLAVGVAGDVPDAFLGRLRTELAQLPAGPPASGGPETLVQGRMPDGLEIEIIAKETRATAISFGHPIAVTRAHPDFAALWLARSWLGEHRASQGRLFQRLRELRGLNYGDYAYVEAFPGGMYRMFPEPNAVRRAQLFEVWIRPVAPENAVFALKLALHELRTLIDRGLSEEEFETTRNYLMKNVFLMTRTQDQQLGYALDSRWYGTGEFTSMMRERLAALTREQVNVAVRRHLSADNLSVVMVAGDAVGLRDELLAGGTRSPAYDAPHPELADEDGLVAATPLPPTPDRLRITPVEEVWAR